MNDEIMRCKIKEKIAEGQETLYNLRLAKVKLDSAGSWKKLDGFGGSILTSMMKHSKTEAALGCLEQARESLVSYQRVLKVLPIPFHIRTEIAVLFSFAIFFLDGEIKEYLEPEKVESAQEQLTDGIDILVNVLLALEKYECELQGNERMEVAENTAVITSLTGIRKSSCATI